MSIRKIRRAYGLAAFHKDTTVTRAVARFPSRRWWAVSTGLLLGHGKLGNRWAIHLATTTYRPPGPSALRQAHQAGLEALGKPPGRIAMALAVLALVVACGLRVYWAWPGATAPKAQNPASVVHLGGSWMDPLARCSGTGVYTSPQGRCVVIPAR
jgi:hypothetical protein